MKGRPLGFVVGQIADRLLGGLCGLAQRVFQESLSLVNLVRKLAIRRLIDCVTDLVDALGDLVFVARNGAFDLFDDIHATPSLSRRRSISAADQSFVLSEPRSAKGLAR